MTASELRLNGLIQTAIDENPHVPVRHLRFETREGHVTLNGEVTSYFQKQMAQEALRQVEGIEEIHNELDVVWS